MSKQAEIGSVTFSKTMAWVPPTGGSRISSQDFAIRIDEHWVVCTELRGKGRTFRVHASKVEFVEDQAPKARAVA